jgi:hypothetical protein
MASNFSSLMSVSFASLENPFVFSVNLGAGQMSMPKKSFFDGFSEEGYRLHNSSEACRLHSGEEMTENIRMGQTAGHAVGNVIGEAQRTTQFGLRERIVRTL